MKIVIEIPDRIYKIVQNRTLNITDDEILENALKNGTPLPKGHGRLIDADALYESSRLCHTEEDGTACVEYREINDAPTIIEGSDSE